MRLSIPLGVLAGVMFSLISVSAFAQPAGRASYIQGENLRKQNKCDEAVLKYQEAAKLEPENYRYPFAEGKCYYKLKQYDLAIGAFETAVSAKPDRTGSAKPDRLFPDEGILRQAEGFIAVCFFRPCARKKPLDEGPPRRAHRGGARRGYLLLPYQVMD